MLHQKIHRLLAVLDASAGIDARAYLKDDVAHGEIFSCQSTHFHHSLHTCAGIIVELLEPMISQDSIFAHDRHYVAGYADGTKVEQRNERAERNAVANGKCLHELEAYATTREVKIRVGVVHTFSIENCHSGGKCFVRNMVVANDKVYAFILGILNLFYSLDATVKHNHEFHSLTLCIIHTTPGHSISLLASIGDIAFHIGIKLGDTPIYQSHSRTTVHIVVTIYHDAFTLAHCLIQSLYGLLHILHEIRVVKFLKLRTEI